MTKEITMMDGFWLWVKRRMEEAEHRANKALQAVEQPLTDEQKAMMKKAEEEATEHAKKVNELASKHFITLWPLMNEGSMRVHGPIYDASKVGDIVAFKVTHKDGESISLDLVKTDPLFDGKGLTALPDGVKPLDKTPSIPSDADFNHLKECEDSLLLPGKPLKELLKGKKAKGEESSVTIKTKGDLKLTPTKTVKKAPKKAKP